jgi:hypothetical protein
MRNDLSKNKDCSSLGFVPKFNGRSNLKKPKNVEKWQSQFGKLKEYHKIHGDCNVPRYWKEDHSLGNWVMRQRSHHNKQRETRESVMDKDRIEKLEVLVSNGGSSVTTGRNVTKRWSTIGIWPYRSNIDKKFMQKYLVSLQSRL